MHCGRQIAAGGDPKAKPTLEQAIRQFHDGLASKKKEDREKTLRSVLPNKKDVETLFPKHAAKLWPLWEKGNDFLLENVDNIAREVTRGGGIKEVKAIDMRKEKNPQGYKELFEIIPKDIPVFDYSIRHVNGDGSGGGSYVYLNQRWLWIKDLDSFPRILEKLK